MRNIQQHKGHVRDLGERIMGAARRLHDLGSGAHADGTLRAGLRSALEELRAAEASLVEEGERLGAENARYHEVFEASLDPCVLTNATGRVADANHAAQILFGRDPVKPPVANILELFERDSRAAAASLLERARAGESVHDEILRVRRTTGNEYHVAASVRVLDLRGDGAVVQWQLRDATPLAGGAVRDDSAVRDEFLGLVSHELKTPIAVIAGNADVLSRRNGQLGQQQRIEALADIRSEAERLRRLVDNMLVLARLERMGEIGRNPVDIGAAVARRVEQHHREWPEREFRIEIAGVPPVDAPEEYVDQALRNLLTNAEQHSPWARPIEIRAREEGEGVLVEVLDRGDGVRERDLAHIFSPFHGAATGERRQGAGIGLAATQRLIDALGGRVRAERREGGGMVFSFWLPAVASTSRPGASSQARGSGG
jgi:PAS domain S-box-containing protein